MSDAVPPYTSTVFSLASCPSWEANQNKRAHDYSVNLNHRHLKRTLSPYFRNLPLLHITIRLHLTWRLLKFMQWLARKQYVLCR